MTKSEKLAKIRVIIADLQREVKAAQDILKEKPES
jgi:hypothetical protein